MINESFIKISELLQSMHVKNNQFFLKTINSDIENINPFSEDLTSEQITAIVDECRDNIWYFLRNIVRTPIRSGFKQYELNLSRLASIYCALLNINHHIVTPRSTGRMTGMVPLLLWEILFNTDYDKIILNDSYNISGNQLFRLMNDYIIYLPKFLQDTIVVDAESGIIYTANTNRIRFKVSTHSVCKQNIENIKLENKNCISIYPEFENMVINTDLLDANDREYKSYSILPSSPVSNDSLCYNKILFFVKLSLKWEEIFYDIDPFALKDKLNDTITRYMYIEHSYTDLGFDSIWFNNACTMLGGNESIIQRELLLQRTK